jgi:hypothetical protein
MTTDQAYILGVEHGYKIGSHRHIPTHDEFLFNAMALDEASRALFMPDHPMAENFSTDVLKMFLRGEMDGINNAYKERREAEHN